MKRFALALVGVAFCAASCTCPSGSSADSPSGVRITARDDRLRVEIHGQLFTEYHFKDVPRPFCYPMLGPQGLPMTRNWPMRDVADETRDHPHHRSFWFAHGAVNGHDFWSEKGSFGRIVQAAILETRSGRDSGLIRTSNLWVSADGKLQCSDVRTLRFYARPDTERVLDFEITLHASNGDVVFGDTKEGTFALRVNETMRVKPAPAHEGKPVGRILLSTGARDTEAWGKRATWCDYSGLVEGRTVGIAIFDHPQNPRHPTWWHVRDYGLFAANPFGRHDFEKLADAHAGDLRIAAGQSVTFRYRIFIHEGDAQQARVADRYAEYVKTVSTR
ncbi:MAG: PmoA family protein [Verrucomicrobiae bacterium]|nr:PmoA family protein [Verrucomicrobiae bacterium]